MKATGIIRRIDDLGRVVIPKEIRRTLRIREGEPLEIFTGEEGEILLKKYSPVGELRKHAKELAESISMTTGHLVCISDQDQIVAAAGLGHKEYKGETISSELEETIAGREAKVFNAQKKDGVNLIGVDKVMMDPVIVQPIISESDAIGAIIIIGAKTSIDESDAKIAQVAAGFLGKQMEG